MKYSIELLVERYLQSKEFSWSATTLRSEKHRLKALSPYLNGDPKILWNYIESALAPYSRVTAFTRATDFWQWCINGGYLSHEEHNQEGSEKEQQGNKSRQGHNPYQAFRQENKKLFKNAYKRKKAPCGFEEAKRRLNTIQNPIIRLKAMSLLMHGLRASELGTVEEGSLYGKGDKRRMLYGLNIPAETLVEIKKVSYSTLRQALANVGLKPHDLRKAFATRLVEMGVNHFDLCEVMGWSSITTATAYIAPRDQKTLNNFVIKATNGNSAKKLS